MTIDSLRHTACTSGIALVVLSFVAAAAHSAPGESEPRPAKIGAEPEARRPIDKKDAKPSAESKDDAELLEAIDPSKARKEDSEIERLERAIEGMRDAQKRIANDETGKSTQELQQRIIDDLEKLLKLLKQQQNRRRNQNQPQNQNQDQSQSQNRQQRERQKVPSPQLDPENSARQKPEEQPGDPQTERKDDPADSEERHDPAKIREAEEARRQQMIKDVWGHLPPRLREQMQSKFSEKYLPKYEELVKRYYESLAEKSRKRSGPAR